MTHFEKLLLYSGDLADLYADIDTCWYFYFCYVSHVRSIFLYFSCPVIPRIICFSLSGPSLPFYCLWYPHEMSFLRNKLPCPLLKSSKPHASQGLKHSRYPKFGKVRVKKSNLCFFTTFTCFFLIYCRHSPIFQNKPWLFCSSPLPTINSLKPNL